MTVHAVIAPSSLARIVQCPGSLSLCKPYENVETDESREGTVAHHVAMMYAIASSTNFAPSGINAVPKVGEEIDGIRVDAEMIAGAKMYAEALEGFAGNPERTVQIPRVHPTECFGTPDFWQYSKNTRTLRVTDYKFGRLYVPVVRNYQLMAYASGILDLLADRGELLEFETTVEFMIVQPRCYSADTPVRAWTTSATNLRSFINIARAATEDALGPDPKTKTGPECLFCDARGVCETAGRAASAIIEYSGKAEAMAQTGHEVGLRLDLINAAIDMLKAVATGLEEQAMARLRKGQTVPFFKIGYSQPRQIWTKTVAEVKTLGALASPPIALVREDFDMTPKQAIKAGLPEAVVNKFSTTPSGKAKLVADDLEQAARVFSRS